MLLVAAMESAPNILDLSIAALLAFFLVRGLVRGFIREAAGLLGVAAAVLAAAAGYQDLGRLARKLTNTDFAWWDAVAFGVILALVFGVVAYLGGLLSRLMARGPFSTLDRFLGAATGLAKGVLVAYLVLNLLLLMMPLGLPPAFRDSWTAPLVIKAGRSLADLVPQDLTRRLQGQAGWLKDWDSAPPKTPPRPAPEGRK